MPLHIGDYVTVKGLSELQAVVLGEEPGRGWKITFIVHAPAVDMVIAAKAPDYLEVGRSKLYGREMHRMGSGYTIVLPELVLLKAGTGVERDSMFVGKPVRVTRPPDKDRVGLVMADRVSARDLPHLVTTADQVVVMFNDGPCVKFTSDLEVVKEISQFEVLELD